MISSRKFHVRAQSIFASSPFSGALYCSGCAKNSAKHPTGCPFSSLPLMPSQIPKQISSILLSSIIGISLPANTSSAVSFARFNGLEKARSIWVFASVFPASIADSRPFSLSGISDCPCILMSLFQSVCPCLIKYKSIVYPLIFVKFP